jgi:hypothetical protein
MFEIEILNEDCHANLIAMNILTLNIVSYCFPEWGYTA